jgi:hypothetical protein
MLNEWALGLFLTSFVLGMGVSWRIRSGSTLRRNLSFLAISLGVIVLAVPYILWKTGNLIVSPTPPALWAELWVLFIFSEIGFNCAIAFNVGGMIHRLIERLK